MVSWISYLMAWNKIFDLDNPFSYSSFSFCLCLESNDKILTFGTFESIATEATGKYNVFLIFFNTNAEIFSSPHKTL